MKDTRIFGKVKGFQQILKRKKFGVKDILQKVVSKDVSKDISWQDLSNEEPVFEIKVLEEEKGEQEIQNCRNAAVTEHEEQHLCFFRCIGGEKDTANRVYCHIELSIIRQIDTTYLQCLFSEYFRLLSAWLSIVLRDTYCENGKDVSAILGTMEKDIEDFWQETERTFLKYIKSIYEIDLNVITEIAGSYYEGKSCDSAIFFDIERRRRPLMKDSVSFQKSIEVNEERIREIRKWMETGDETRYLVVRKNVNGRWKLSGLCNKNALGRGITFKVIRHMVWNMEIDGKKAVCYECGKYLIDCEEFARRRFKKKYEELFGKTSLDAALLVFEAAKSQEHGTIAILLEHSSIEDKAKELIKKSVGMKISPKRIDVDTMHNLASIDGAALFDERGKCYASNVILIAKTEVKGNSERGARYNSAYKYIGAMKKDGIRAIGIVVSEDKTIDIMSTTDEMEILNEEG